MKKAVRKTQPAGPAPAPSEARRRDPASPISSEAELLAMPESDYMNQAQLDFFRIVLIAQRNELLARRQSTAAELTQQPDSYADPADRASAEEERVLAMRLRERESLLIRKIEESLGHITDKSYGYCVKTGEPIGLRRLLARPTATVCIQVKDHDERQETHFRSR